MKVLMLTNLYKPHVGGVERHVEKLCEKLIDRGFHIKIITSKYDRDLKEREKYLGIEIIRLKYPKIKYLGIFKIWLDLIRNINEIKNADIIHIHDVFIWYLPIRMLLPSKKVFVTFHGYISYPLTFKAKFIQKLSARLSYGNICIGSVIEKWYGIKADIISYGAVDLDKYKITGTKKLKYDAIFASRLDDQTGILTYLDAIDILKNKGINFKLLVLGEGKYFKNAKAKAYAEGFVTDPENYYGLAKFAFVNRYLAILEAFASKKLVIAVYDNPLKEDYLKMTPYKNQIIVENDPVILSEKVIYYFNHPDKEKEITQKAFKWVQNMTWDKMTDDYITLWEKK